MGQSCGTEAFPWGSVLTSGSQCQPWCRKQAHLVLEVFTLCLEEWFVSSLGVIVTSRCTRGGALGTCDAVSLAAVVHSNRGLSSFHKDLEDIEIIILVDGGP